MILKALLKNRITDFIFKLSADYNVYAPRAYPGGDVWFDLFDPEDGSRTLVFDNVNTIFSAKDIFFPQLETMFEFTESGAGTIADPVPEPAAKPILIFGIRPCDLKAVLFIDEFFKRKFDDAYYANRISDRCLIAIGCSAPPRQSCFCTSAGTGPFAESGFDLQFVEAGDRYIVESGSEKGDKLIDKHAFFFDTLPDKDAAALAAIKKTACDAVKLNVDFGKALDLMAQTEFFPEHVYARISERCIYCGACLYTCPTCTCFNVFDNAKNGTGERLRNWDCCIFEGYTREASGHNPRLSKIIRTARRYEHKLKYDYKATGTSGCVGCGRCLLHCPVNIGISEFIREITGMKAGSR
jgi:sulfhydrogenase subunit beta (sulfur reductase)